MSEQCSQAAKGRPGTRLPGFRLQMVHMRLTDIILSYPCLNTETAAFDLPLPGVAESARIPARKGDLRRLSSVVFSSADDRTITCVNGFVAAVRRLFAVISEDATGIDSIQICFTHLVTASH